MMPMDAATRMLANPLTSCGRHGIPTERGLQMHFLAYVKQLQALDRLQLRAAAIHCVLDVSPVFRPDRSTI